MWTRFVTNHPFGASPSMRPTEVVASGSRFGGHLSPFACLPCSSTSIGKGRRGWGRRNSVEKSCVVEYHSRYSVLLVTLLHTSSSVPSPSFPSPQNGRSRVVPYLAHHQIRGAAFGTGRSWASQSSQLSDRCDCGGHMFLFPDTFWLYPHTTVLKGPLFKRCNAFWCCVWLSTFSFCCEWPVPIRNCIFGLLHMAELQIASPSWRGKVLICSLLHLEWVLCLFL